MLPSLATLDQLKDRMNVEDDIAAQAALDDASALVRGVARPCTWVDDEGNLTEVPDQIQVIVLNAVKRYLNNPDGYASIQVSQFSASVRGAGAAGTVTLTKDEKLEILRVVRGSLVRSVQLSAPLPGHKCKHKEECLKCLKKMMGGESL